MQRLKLLTGSGAVDVAPAMVYGLV